MDRVEVEPVIKYQNNGLGKQIISTKIRWHNIQGKGPRGPLKKRKKRGKFAICALILFFNFMHFIPWGGGQRNSGGTPICAVQEWILEEEK